MAVDKSRIGGLWLVYGIPGTGKTLIGGLADGLVPAVEHGRTVYTNISGLSIAGIASVCGVEPICVDVRMLETVEDVLEAFDGENTNNTLFILDEMKQFASTNEKAWDWLAQRLNIMRKRSNDFIMIAQVEEYFPLEVRKLAKGCTLYKRCFGWGSKSRTQEFRFDGGKIVISNGKLQPNGYKVRRLPSELFMCYKSGIDGLIGIEDNARHNSIWTGPKAIIAYAFILFMLLMVGFGIYMFINIKGSVGSLGSALAGRPSSVLADSVQTKKAVKHEKKELCFNRKICDSEVCKTDAGEFSLSSWSGEFGGFFAPAGLVRRCSGD